MIYRVFFAALFIALALPAGIFVARADTTGGVATSSLQAQIDANNQQIADLNQQIATYQAQLTQIGANKKTLQQAISALNIQRSKVEAQVSATERQINVTQLQIEQLGNEIVDASQTISTDQAAIGEDVLMLQKAGNQPLFMQILSSANLVEAWSGVNATLQVQEAIQNKIQTLQSQKSALVNSQTISQQKQATLAAQKQSLASQQQTLVSTEASKSRTFERDESARIEL